MPASSSDLKNAWLILPAFYANTIATTAGTPLGGTAGDFSDGHELTCAVITLGLTTGANSPTFGLQESTSSTGTFTPITDANASITLSNTGSNTFGVITGQRQYQYVRVAVNSSTTDTINVCGWLADIRTQMPLGASGASRWPAGPSTVV